MLARVARTTQGRVFSLRCLATGTNLPPANLPKDQRKQALNEWIEQLHSQRATERFGITEVDRTRFQGLVFEKYMRIRQQQKKSLYRIGAVLIALLSEFPPLTQRACLSTSCFAVLSYLQSAGTAK
jgi:hypothetical protein